MLFFTLLVAVIVVIASSSKIFEEDYRRPAVTQQMVDQINVSFEPDLLFYPPYL